MYHIVTFTGPFGFLKPWTAVRDGETRSQQFLTPSVVEGMRQKLEVSAILRHRLRYAGISDQQEQTQPRAWQKQRPYSVINRGLLLRPILLLAFPTLEDAENAATQHICLCRNEDLLYPQGNPEILTIEQFDEKEGIELIFGPSDDAFCVGFNRFTKGEPMYGSLRIVGNPIHTESGFEV